MIEYNFKVIITITDIVHKDYPRSNSFCDYWSQSCLINMLNLQVFIIYFQIYLEKKFLNCRFPAKEVYDEYDEENTE